LKTSLSAGQLADPQVAEVAAILGKCTNCGCCNSACPTYELTGDEREAPRGRINIIRDLFERGGTPDRDAVAHIDSCLSCLSCTVACPSGVDYMHLVDHARERIETSYRRPLFERLMRTAMSRILPYPARFRTAMTLGRWARPLAGMLSRVNTTRPLATMLQSLPASASEAPRAGARVYAAVGMRVKRVLLPSGCVQSELDPAINQTAIHLLTHLGVEVVVPRADGCCGALSHHLGKAAAAREQVAQTLTGWRREFDNFEIDAIVSTATGCGTTLMDYGHLMRGDSQLGGFAAKVANLTLDVMSFVAGLRLPESQLPRPVRVAYQAACSLQHGQKRLEEPKQLLRRAGFTVLSPKNEHLCCGSAGTYSLLHPATSDALREAKIQSLEQLNADVIVGGNFGCLAHLGARTRLPVMHTLMLLDWAYTGIVPAPLSSLQVAAAGTGA
jgi:glycolate oxidase iron-sulfur subunit